MNIVMADSKEVAESVTEGLTALETKNGAPGIGWHRHGDHWRPPQPHPSWVWLNDAWNAPKPIPSDDISWVWDEETLSWVDTNIEALKKRESLPDIVHRQETQINDLTNRLAALET
jgi:hypothetical protein